ncbi:hypothetical protein MMC25_001721 [Agyrium rufum]|nr:hypothetical protein [Agyrium rufum]
MGKPQATAGVEVDPAQSQVARMFQLGSYFLSGCLAVNASQFLGAPLYLINEDWYNSWIAFTKQSFGLLMMSLTQQWAPTVVRVSGDRSVAGQLRQTREGNLYCNFPDRIIMMANHQIYTDWLYMWWTAYAGGMHGRIYIILKESLRHIPVIGWGMQMSQFIFLKRNWAKDKKNLSAHLQTLNKKDKPMWLLLFPEGTNLAPSTREASKSWADKNGIRDMKHQLLPRSTGLQFCVQELRETVGYIYDCTIAYEGVSHGEYAQDIFTMQASYLQGNPPKSVNMYWRRFAISSIPVDDPNAFELWLRTRWMEKDALLERFLKTGRFPANDGYEQLPGGRDKKGAYIETEVKPFNWYEFLQIFAPMGAISMVLYMFYNALPGKMTKSVEKQASLDTGGTMKDIQFRIPKGVAQFGSQAKMWAAGTQGQDNKPVAIKQASNGTPKAAAARKVTVQKAPNSAAAPTKTAKPSTAIRKAAPTTSTQAVTKPKTLPTKPTAQTTVTTRPTTAQAKPSSSKQPLQLQKSNVNKLPTTTMRKPVNQSDAGWETIYSAAPSKISTNTKPAPKLASNGVATRPVAKPAAPASKAAASKVAAPKTSLTAQPPKLKTAAATAKTTAAKAAPAKSTGPGAVGQKDQANGAVKKAPVKAAPAKTTTPAKTAQSTNTQAKSKVRASSAKAKG